MSKRKCWRTRWILGQIAEIYTGRRKQFVCELRANFVRIGVGALVHVCDNYTSFWICYD